MAKFLFIGANQWQLPAEPTADEVRGRIAQSMRSGEVFEIVVELRDEPRNRTQLIINGSALSHAAIVETPDPEPVLDSFVE